MARVHGRTSRTGDGVRHIVLIRSGATDWTGSGRFTGRADPHLTDLGRLQADAIAHRIADRWPPDLIYSSTASRATDTARAISAWCRCTWQAWPALADTDFGEWTGLTRPEAKRRDPSLFGGWLTAPAKTVFPGGDRLAALQARARNVLASLGSRPEARNVVLVGHGGINRGILLEAMSLPLSHYHRLPQSPACTNVIALHRLARTVVSIDDTGHLESPGV